jgi:antitoxin PrlF
MNELEYSKLSSKGQTTIPATIRRQLGIRPGDAICYQVKEGAVHLSKVEKIDVEWAQAIESTLGEWAGDEDDDL